MQAWHGILVEKIQELQANFKVGSMRRARLLIRTGNKLACDLIRSKVFRDE